MQTSNIKTRVLSNDGTLGFFMVKYMKDKAHELSMDLFSCWVVEYLIIPYKKEDAPLTWISEKLGFRKVPTIDKLYFRLKSLTINSTHHANK